MAANAELTNAEWTLEQNQSLFKAGAIAERDLKTSQQAVATARARLAAAAARLRASGNEARDTRVLAPASGVLEKRLVDAGVHLSRGAPMFTIVRSGTLELAAAVPARQATAVRAGQAVHFVADGAAVRRQGRARQPDDRSGHARRHRVRAGPESRQHAARRHLRHRPRGEPHARRTSSPFPTAALRQGQEDGKPFVYRIDGKTLNIAPVQLGVGGRAAGRRAGHRGAPGRRPDRRRQRRHARPWHAGHDRRHRTAGSPRRRRAGAPRPLIQHQVLRCSSQTSRSSGPSSPP